MVEPERADPGRHAIDVPMLHRDGHLDTYQSYQGSAIFECDYIVTFLGLEHSRAKLIGVYEVNGQIDPRRVKLPKSFPYQGFADSPFYYDMERCSGFEDLVDRVVIKWVNPISWHQWLGEREVIEILPEGYLTEFPGFQDVLLDFSELVKIVDNPEANRQWHTHLSSVAGVYLIADVLTGKQYVGSAYGKQGILGRWKSYAKTGHGGNAMLCKLLASKSDYANNFQFSILQALDKSFTKNEVIQRERFWKQKLGTKAFGLTLN